MGEEAEEVEAEIAREEIEIVEMEINRETYRKRRKVLIISAMGAGCFLLFILSVLISSRASCVCRSNPTRAGPCIKHLRCFRKGYSRRLKRAQRLTANTNAAPCYHTHTTLLSFSKCLYLCSSFVAFLLPCLL